MTDDNNAGEQTNNVTGRVAKPANQRGSARLGAVQALYQMDIGRTSLNDTMENFSKFLLGKEVDGEQYLPADVDFFGQIIKGVIANQLAIDPIIDGALPAEWPVTRIDSTLRAVLRAAVFELTKRPDIPSKVVISEYLDVARAFFEDDVLRLVNGVLDTVARQVQSEAPETD